MLSKDVKTFDRCPSKKRVATYKVPNGVEVVEEKAFACCGFERIELPESLRTIKKRAFLGCDVKKLRLPSSFDGAGSFSSLGPRLLFGFKGAPKLELEVGSNCSKSRYYNGCLLARVGKTLLWGRRGVAKANSSFRKGDEASESGAFYPGQFPSVKLPES